MNGLLIIDKPEDWTSHDVVARVRRLLREKRVGHTGTLDPFATGVLVVLVGRATRLAQFLAGAEKEYEAIIRFGYATQTGDVTGQPRSDEPPVMVDASILSETRIEDALDSLRGEIWQVPPMYSAKKVAGKKLYELARRGEEVTRAAVRVRVSVLEVLRPEESSDEPGDVNEVDDPGNLWRRNQDGTGDMRVRVVCSAGTYIRTLAESVGERLGVGAHLASLRRTRAGAFRIKESIGLGKLQELVEEIPATTVVLPTGCAMSETTDAKKIPEARRPINKSQWLSEIFVSPDAALPWMPFVHLSSDEEQRVRHGAPMSIDKQMAADWMDGEQVRMRDAESELIAVGVYHQATGQVKPRILLVADEK